ncbi:hypothetical protein H4219_003424, partial [Mycoemilia scoparia]
LPQDTAALFVSSDMSTDCLESKLFSVSLAFDNFGNHSEGTGSPNAILSGNSILELANRYADAIKASI